MLLCGNTFSQQDTINKVCISIETAQKIGEDLIMYDACKEENEVLKDDIKLLKENIQDKDTIIFTLKKVVIKSDLLDNINKSIIKTTESNYDILKDTLKKENKKSWIKDVVILTLIFGIIIK